jgi:hypothetical protein
LRAGDPLVVNVARILMERHALVRDHRVAGAREIDQPELLGWLGNF